MQHKCNICNYEWKGRKPRLGGKYPVACPKCQSRIWHTGTQKETVSLEIAETIDYEDATNQGGKEWHVCMYFDDTSDVIASCVLPGINVATIEVPLGVVDVTWRNITRPASHPSERGCYITMPLVLCLNHVQLLQQRALPDKNVMTKKPAIR